jgi:Kelch motif
MHTCCLAAFKHETTSADRYMLGGKYLMLCYGALLYVNCMFANKFTGGFGTLSELWLKDKTPENCLSSVEIYDPETNSWTMGPPLPVALCAMGVVKYYGTIYVLGMH